MDSLTQVVLGAAVGEAVLGKKVGNKAMIWGAVAGTIPDLDVYLRYFTDPVTASEMHRGFTHSLVFAVLMAFILGFAVWKKPKVTMIAFLAILAAFPILGGGSILSILIALSLLGVATYFILKRTEDTLIASRWDWTKLFFWTVVTHPLLDAHTTWGTQFFWPFDLRLAYKNIFVVDPLYTLPFLVFTLIAFFMKRTNPKRSLMNKIGLIVSSAYMALSLVFKGISHYKFEARLEEEHIEYVDLDSKPAPLNTFLWNAQVETKTGFRIAYYSLFDSKPIQFSEEFPKNHHLIAPYKNQKVIKQLIKISDGWYMIEQEGDRLFFVDLRFGQLSFDPNSKNFLWRFELIVDKNGKVNAERLQPNLQKAGDMQAIMGQLWNRMWGN